MAGPRPPFPDPLTFYDTSSYGPSAIRALADLVGSGQLLYGSDRPVVEPDPLPRARRPRLRPGCPLRLGRAGSGSLDDGAIQAMELAGTDEVGKRAANWCEAK